MLENNAEFETMDHQRVQLQYLHWNLQAPCSFRFQIQLRVVGERDLVETAGHQIEKSDDVEMKPPLLQLQWLHQKLQAARWDLVETAGHQIQKSDDVKMKLENNAEFETEEPPLVQLQYLHWKLQAPRGMDVLQSTQLVHGWIFGSCNI